MRARANLIHIFKGKMREVWLIVLFLFSTLFTGYVYGYGKPLKPIEGSPMRFAVIGDRTGTHEPGIYGQIVEEIQRMRPDFLLSVGDLIEGYTDDTVEVKREWEEYKKLLKPLTMPIYLAPGNHDIWDSTSLELYRRYIGEPHYSFDIGDAHFVILDNSRYDTVGAFPKEQIDWLIEDLEKNKKAIYTFIVSHIPYWIETIANDKADTLHALFVEYGVDAVFTGHYHEYFSGEFDGIMYTGLGSSGGGCSPGPTGLKYHFMWVTVDRNGISIAPIKMNAVLPWDEVTAVEYRLVNKIKDEAVDIEKVSVRRDLTVPETRIRVNVRNLNSHLTLKDTIRWEMPIGWGITPKNLPVEIGALESEVVDFTGEATGALYPTPILSIQYPYAEGKKFEMKRELGISRTVYAYKTGKPPLIDGRITEGVWKRPTAKFFAPDGSPTVTEPANFYFAWDKNNLYLAAKCLETRMDSIVATATKHDGAVYAEDCVGYFLQSEVADGPVYQIYFNPSGTPFDQKIMVKEKKAIAVEREWNGTYDVETFRGKDYWSIEVKIPLSELNTEGEAGKAWAINFRRKQKRLNSAADWQVPISYDPKDYGVLLMK